MVIITCVKPRGVPEEYSEMVNLKTKFEKHANDNEKRRKSIKEREKAKSNQCQIIRQALSSSVLANNSSKKKIIFNEADDFEIEAENSNNFSKSGENGKSTLFESSDSEGDFEFKEKSQFCGKKGFELLNLQSTYGNDERFKIDERFLEDEKEEEVVEGDSKTPVNADCDDEKVKQLKILENVLGTPVITPDKEKKAKKRTTEMVRYDASNKDHEIYEINNQIKTPLKKLTPSQKRKERKQKKEKMKTTETEIEDLPTPKVSKEKFYKVSNEMKNRFKEKNEGGQFSLLQTYGLNGSGVSEEGEEEFQENLVKESFEDEKNYETEMEHEIEKKIVKEKPESDVKGMLARGIWKESFFFVQDDPRFKEGLDFINKKNSEEANAAAENYDKTRKRLKEILRLHVKKQMHKKDPFKNKVGGMNKKQLAGSKSKNHRMPLNNRKPPKKNFGGRT